MSMATIRKHRLKWQVRVRRECVPASPELQEEAVTTAAFAKYRDERLQGIKPNSLKRQPNPIQNMFNVAKRDWDIPVHARFPCNREFRFKPRRLNWLW
jgi:hypothetical protein